MFKKRLLIFVLMLIFLKVQANAADFKIFDLRNKIFDESKGIRELMPKSKDVLALVSMFDTCIIASSQIDAYFTMLSIFDSIKKKDLNSAPVDSLINWLNEMKMTNNLNIKNLDNFSAQIESKTGSHLSRLKVYFGELNQLIDKELIKTNYIKKSLKIK